MEKSAEERSVNRQDWQDRPDPEQVSGVNAEDADLREPDIRSYVDNYRTRKVSKAQIEKGISSEFGLTTDEAREKMEEYW